MEKHNMQILNDNTDLYPAIRHLPVIRLDVSKPNEYCLGKAAFRLDVGRTSIYDGMPSFTRHEVAIYNDTCFPTIRDICTCLSSSKDYEDVSESVKYAVAPVVRNGDTIVLCVDNPIKRRCFFVTLTIKVSPTSGLLYFDDFRMVVRDTTAPIFSNLLSKIR